MYTIEQMQAADFLLKRLSENNRLAIHGKKIKFVIQANGVIWYGDFVSVTENLIMSKSFPVQTFINDFGGLNSEIMYFHGDNATSVFKKVWDKYKSECLLKEYFENPFNEMKSLDLLFNTVMKLADIKAEDSPIYPYLLNAQSLDGQYKLPFINLENQPFNVISLIEVTNESE